MLATARAPEKDALRAAEPLGHPWSCPLIPSFPVSHGSQHCVWSILLLLLFKYIYILLVSELRVVCLSCMFLKGLLL